MTTENKILVVGGGIAGISFAYVVKKLGYDVTVIDFASAERERAEVFTDRAAKELCVLFGDDIWSEIPHNNYSAAGFYFDKSSLVLRREINTRFVDRATLLKVLTNKYLELGGELVNDHATYVNVFNKTVTVDNGQKYYYDILVGADGIASRTRFDCYSSFTVDEKWPESKNVHIKYDAIFANDTDDSPEPMFILASGDGFQNAQRVPSGSDIRLGVDNVLFLGTAASLVDPATGDGIYYALKSAACLVCSIKWADDVEYTVLDIYNLQMGEALREIKKRRKLRKQITGKRRESLIRGANGLFGKKRLDKLVRKILY